jgi:plastocyanin
MRRSRVASAVCVAALAGCGGDGEEGGEGSRAVTVAAGREVRVAADEYSFAPASIVMTGGPGSFAVSLDNGGALAHNLKVFDGERQLGGTPTFQGGETRSGSVRLEPGRYRLVCTVGDHAELGMVGTLQVR